MLSHLALGTDLSRKQRDYLNKISASANNELSYHDKHPMFRSVQHVPLRCPC